MTAQTESDVPADVPGLLHEIDKAGDELWRLVAGRRRAGTGPYAFRDAAARLATLAQALGGAAENERVEIVRTAEIALDPDADSVGFFADDSEAGERR